MGLNSSKQQTCRWGWCKMARAWADGTCGAGAGYDGRRVVAARRTSRLPCSEHIQIEGVFTLVFDPPEINGGRLRFLVPGHRRASVPSFADDQDEDEPEDQSEDQDADADEPEDQSEDQSEGD